MEPEVQSEASIIESIKGLVPESGYSIGQVEEAEAKPEAAAEPKQEAKPETREIAETKPAAEAPEAKVPEDDEEIEIKGERYKVPKAIKESIMLQADYTKKTMALAEERKALEAEKGKLDPNITAKLSHYERLLGDAVQQDQNTDWVKLLREDPIGYLEKKEIANARANEWQQANARNQQNYAAMRSQVETKEKEQLTAKLPELKDTAAYEAHDKRVKSFLDKEGYKPQEVDAALADHRVRLMLEDAIKYRSLQTEKAETVKKIEKLPPKVERPGVPSGTEGQASKAAMANLRKSGSLDDGAAAIRALMG